MMVLGRYTRRDFHFDRYIAPCFPMEDHSGCGSCGEDAVFSLTGKGFTRQERKRFGKVLTRQNMVKLLRKRGYTVIPLSVCMVSNHKWFRDTVTSQHVVLNCQLFYRHEASWSICYNDLYCHNGLWESPKATEFIARPIIASYIIWHRKWA